MGRNFFIILFSVLTLCYPWSAQTSEPSMTLNHQQVEVGDTFKVSLQIPSSSYFENWDWNALIQNTALDIYEVLPTDTFQVEEDLWIRLNAYFMAFDSGHVELGPVEFMENVIVPSVYIDVSLVDVDTTKAFMDIQDAPKLPFWWGDYWYIYMTIVFVALVVLIYFLWKRRQKYKEHQMVIDKYNAHEWALDELRKIELQYAETRPEEMKPFFDDILLLFKKYLVYRYNWNAVEETSEELIDGLKNHEDFRRFRKEVRSLLNTSDLVKFAKASVLEEEKTKQWAFLKNMIKATKYVASENK